MFFGLYIESGYFTKFELVVGPKNNGGYDSININLGGNTPPPGPVDPIDTALATLLGFGLLTVTRRFVA